MKNKRMLFRTPRIPLGMPRSVKTQKLYANGIPSGMHPYRMPLLPPFPFLLPSETSLTGCALVNIILAAKKENPAADTAALEREIDLLVYGLYVLTEEEIGVIEK